jgi:D,D-heptose 1,7-bisphosphate phosphatase
MNKAVFLDRDGVITQEPPHYVHRIGDLEFISGSPEAIRLLNLNNFVVIIISNQSGIARGYYPEEDTVIFNLAMKKKLSEFGAYIDAIYYCPHHPEARVEKYRIDCDCRKPKNGMLKLAKKNMNLDLRQSFVVGDRWSDIECGKISECKTILVKTGSGEKSLKSNKIPCNYIANDLDDAVEYILSLEQKRIKKKDFL